MSSTKFVWPFVLAVLASACGGGSGGGSGSSGAQTGTVTMTMSDGPIDGYSQVIMVISQIRFIANGGQDVLVLDEPKSIDFLALSNFSEVLTQREVVAGTYSKIRLVLDSLTLVKTDAAGNVVQSDDVPLNGLQKIDINPQGPFQVRGGEDIVIHLDLDLDRSIHVVTTGNGGVRFRPVVFAQISTQFALDKLFRVEGTIDSMSTNDTMSVCDIRHVSDDGARLPNPKELCVFTRPDANTIYFDETAMPLPTGFDGLAENDAVVMYGKFDPAAASDTFVPAVIALGSRDTFARERGISSNFVPDPADATAPGTVNLDEVNAVCLLTPAQREVSVAAETAVFTEDALGAATRIDRIDIERCRATEAEGTAMDGSPALLRSFVMIQGASVTAEEELIGTLVAFSGGRAGQYTLTPTPPASGDQCVVIDSSTVITQIETVGGVANVIHPAAVPTGVEISAIGVRDTFDGCPLATEIVREI